MRATVSGRPVWHDGPVPAPQHCPSPRELDDLELLLTAHSPPAPLRRLRPGHHPGPPRRAGRRAERSSWSTPRASLSLSTPPSRSARWPPRLGPFRRLHLSPTEVREQYAGALTVPVAAPLTVPDLD